MEFELGGGLTISTGDDDGVVFPCGYTAGLGAELRNTIENAGHGSAYEVVGNENGKRSRFAVRRRSDRAPGVSIMLGTNSDGRTGAMVTHYPSTNMPAPLVEAIEGTVQAVAGSVHRCVS